MTGFKKDLQYYKFCAYGFLKNLRFFEPFLILFFLEKDISFLQIGIIYTIREITRNILEIPAGIAADVLGRRRTMISSFALYILSFLLYSFSGSLWVLYLATVVFGLGEAFRTGTHKAMIFDYLQFMGWSEYKVDYYGHTRSWSQAGSAVSALAAGFLVFFSGKYLNIFLYSTIPYLLGLLLILSYPVRLDGRRVSLSTSGIWKSTKATLLEFRRSFRNPGILRGIINVSSHGGYYRAVKDYLQPIIQTFALSVPVLMSLDGERKSALMIGFIYFLIYLLSSGASARSGLFTGRFRGLAPALNYTLIAGFMAGALSGLFFYLDLLMLSILLFVLVYLVENLRRPAGISWFSEQLDPSILATALSVESQGKSVFTAVLALGMGLLADKFGPGTALLAVSAGMLLLAPVLRIKMSG